MLSAVMSDSSSATAAEGAAQPWWLPQLQQHVISNIGPRPVSETGCVLGMSDGDVKAGQSLAVYFVAFYAIANIMHQMQHLLSGTWPSAPPPLAWLISD
jgi:hypothetical protein